MSMTLNVELVSPQERVWSGQAKFISARTIEGDLGVLTDHAPLFGVLVDGVVRVEVPSTPSTGRTSSTSTPKSVA